MPKGNATQPHSKIAGISDQAVQAATGRSWAQWFDALTKAGAAKLDHKSIATLLSEKFDCPMWWSQMVTVGYEQAHGRRKVHETSKGFQVGVSKTFAVPVSELYASWENEKCRSDWLRSPAMTIRKATKNKSMRITWETDGSNVEALFYAKGPGKSSVSVQQNKLADERRVREVRAYWSAALRDLEGHLQHHRASAAAKNDRPAAKKLSTPGQAKTKRPASSKARAASRSPRPRHSTPRGRTSRASAPRAAR